MLAACLAAAGLIAACVGSIPDRGDSVRITRACVERFPADVRMSARTCARLRGVRWSYARKPVKWR